MLVLQKQTNSPNSNNLATSLIKTFGTGGNFDKKKLCASVISYAAFTGNLSLKKGFQNPHLAFYPQQMDKPLKIRIKTGAFWLIFFQSWSWSF